jgi:hypothetical protein
MFDSVRLAPSSMRAAKRPKLLEASSCNRVSASRACVCYEVEVESEYFGLRVSRRRKKKSELT